jgi:hypothetical protein
MPLPSIASTAPVCAAPDRRVHDESPELSVLHLRAMDAGGDRQTMIAFALHLVDRQRSVFVAEEALVVHDLWIDAVRRAAWAIWVADGSPAIAALLATVHLAAWDHASKSLRVALDAGTDAEAYRRSIAYRTLGHAVRAQAARSASRAGTVDSVAAQMRDAMECDRDGYAGPGAHGRGGASPIEMPTEAEYADMLFATLRAVHGGTVPVPPLTPADLLVLSSAANARTGLLVTMLAPLASTEGRVPARPSSRIAR